MPDQNIDKPSAPSRAVLFLLLVTILLGAFIRFAYYRSLCSDPLPTLVSATNIMDQHRFIELAKEFASGQWLGTSVLRYSPTYSYFIAIIFKLFGQDMYHIFFVQLLIGVVAPLLYYKTASLLFNNPRVGLICAFIAALYSPFIFFEGALLRASLIAFFNLLSFYFLLVAIKKDRPCHYLFGGIAVGLSALLRPNILPFILISYVLIITKEPKKNLRFAALLSIGVLLTVAPLTARNKILKNDVLISFQGPSTFWIGNTHDSSGIGLWRSPLREQFAQEAHGSTMKTLGILFREIRRHPLEYAALYGRKIKMYFNAYEIPGNLSYDQFAENHAPLRWAVFNFGIVCPLAILGLFLCWRKYPFISLGYVYFIVLGLSNILFHIQGRYRIPAVPFFILFAALGAYRIICAVICRNYKPAVLGAIFVIAVTFMVAPDTAIIRKYFGGLVRAGDFSNRTIAHYLLYKHEGEHWSRKQKQEVLAAGLEDLRKEFNVYPKRAYGDMANNLTLQSILLTEMGNPQKAKKAINYALNLSPDQRDVLLEMKTTGVFYREETFKNLSFKTLVSKRGFQKIFQ